MRASYSERLSSRQKTNYRLASRDCFWEEGGFVDEILLLLHGIEPSVCCVKYWGPPYVICFVNRLEIAQKSLPIRLEVFVVISSTAHPLNVPVLYIELKLWEIVNSCVVLYYVVPHPIFYYHEDTRLLVLRIRITLMRNRIRLITLMRIRIRLITLMRIRMRVPKMMRIGSTTLSDGPTLCFWHNRPS